jgi:hypothetical protein
LRWADRGQLFWAGAGLLTVGFAPHATAGADLLGVSSCINGIHQSPSLAHVMDHGWILHALGTGVLPDVSYDILQDVRDAFGLLDAVDEVLGEDPRGMTVHFVGQSVDLRCIAKDGVAFHLGFVPWGWLVLGVGILVPADV